MFALVREVPDFRRLWLAQVVSQGGDWLNHIALLVLIGRLGGERAAAGVGFLFGLEIVLRMLPTTFMGPIAGGVADRFPRRTLMIGADLVRACVVLGFLLVRDADDLWLLYTLSVAQMSVALFFDASRSASTAQSVPRADLQTAHALTAVTWSSMLAIGAFLGGTLVEAIGTDGVFVLDSLTYLISIAFLRKLTVGRIPASIDVWRWGEVLRFKDMAQGWRHARERGVQTFVLAKAAWGGAGGYLVVLAIAGRHYEEAGLGAGLATGLLFAARGIGTGIGPVFARRVFPGDENSLRWQIAAGFGIGAAGYALFGAATSFPIAVLGIGLAHTGGSNLWVTSSVLWQRTVDDAYRGRVYALEVFAMTLAFSTSALATGLFYDHVGRLDLTTWVVSAFVVVAGVVWTLIDRHRLRRMARTRTT
ncbi:MAG: MFS transporter [Planctomycetota bacterium]